MHRIPRRHGTRPRPWEKQKSRRKRSRPRRARETAREKRSGDRNENRDVKREIGKAGAIEDNLNPPTISDSLSAMKWGRGLGEVVLGEQGAKPSPSMIKTNFV